MRGFLAVARREILEKRFVFAAAAAASLVPFAAPLVRGLHGRAAVEVRDWIAIILAAVFGAGLAVALGTTVVSSELADRRLGFYFSRPLTGFAIWAGKLGAACLIALAAAAIIYIPTLAADGGRVVLIDLPAGAPAAFALAIVAVVLLCHAAGIAIRGRSPLLGLDLIALVLLVLGAIFVLKRLEREFAGEALEWAKAVLIVAPLAGLVVSGLLAVTRGRTDGQAAHRTLSTTLWAILGASVLALAGYASWVLSAAPADLAEVDWVLPASKGSWVIVEGPARGGRPAFLLDVGTGRHQRAGADWRWPVLSPDGAHAAWLEPSGGEGPFDLMTWKLDEPASKPARTNLAVAGAPLALSEHGERLATLTAGLLSIYDLSTGASLGSARVAGEQPYYPRGFFLDTNRFRIFRPSVGTGPTEGRLDILEFDIPTKTLKVTGTMAIDGPSSIAYRTNSEGNRLLVREKDRFTLRDGASGALLATLAKRGPATSVWGSFLAEGRIALSVAEGSGVRVEIFAADGRHERTLSIPAHDRIITGGEAAPGKLIVAAGGEMNERASRTLFLADVSSGEVRRVADGLFPTAVGWVQGPHYLPEPGSEATKLFYGPGRSLVHFDALTGQRRVILRGSSR